MLLHEKWCDDLPLVDEHYHRSWEHFYRYTAHIFQSHEVCECFHRELGMGYTAEEAKTVKMGEIDTWLQCENRRFYSPKWNTTVWFFLWYGDKAMPHGHFNISEDIQPLPCMPGKCDKQAKGTVPIWELHPSEFIYQFVKIHNPHLLVLNTGLHTAFDGKNDFYLREAYYFKSYAAQLLHLQQQQQQQQMRGSSSSSSSSVAITKWVFKSVTPQIAEGHIDDRREGDFGALELAVNNVWEYWDITALILQLYTVYRKVELPWTYYTARDRVKAIVNAATIATSSSSKKGGTIMISVNRTAIESSPVLKEIKSRGFSWDNTHFTPWVYHELNKVLIDKYLLPRK